MRIVFLRQEAGFGVGHLGKVILDVLLELLCRLYTGTRLGGTVSRSRCLLSSISLIGSRCSSGGKGTMWAFVSSYKA